jgi:hypothetical protein
MWNEQAHSGPVQVIGSVYRYKVLAAIVTMQRAQTKYDELCSNRRNNKFYSRSLNYKTLYSGN